MRGELKSSEKIKRSRDQKKARMREVAIACLLSHPTLGRAAKAAGIAEITLRRWLKIPTSLKHTSEHGRNDRARRRTSEADELTGGWSATESARRQGRRRPPRRSPARG